MEIIMEMKINNYVKVSAGGAKGKVLLVSNGYGANLTYEEAQELIRALQIAMSGGIEALAENKSQSLPSAPDPKHDAHSAWDDEEK